MSVLDSVMLSPTARCNELRSSTAPSESTPASISGASASMELPAVRRTIASTASNENPHATRCSIVGAHARSVMAGATTMLDRKAGAAPQPVMRSHCTGTMPRSGDACGSIAACSAPRP